VRGRWGEGVTELAMDYGTYVNCTQSDFILIKPKISKPDFKTIVNWEV
jgi:hypothetical protein